MLKRYGLIQVIVAMLVFATIPVALAGPGGTDRPFKGDGFGDRPVRRRGNPMA